MSDRRRWVVATALTAALLSAGGLVGASFVRSPEQQRAEARAPQPSVLTAAVEERILASTVVSRGTVAAARQIAVTPAAAQGAAIAVVTAVRTQVGATVQRGGVALAVSGRPLIALPGDVPAYRDMRPGEEGADIAQLQKALRALGHYRFGDRSGYFGAATKDGVRRLYEGVGFQVATTGDTAEGGDRSALRAADDAVTAAQLALDELTGRLAVTTPAPGELPEARQLATARAALDRAREDRRSLVARTGPMVPLAEIAFLPGFPATVTQLTAKVGDAVSAPLITFASGQLGITAKLQPEQADLLRTGMAVDILAESTGSRAKGTVKSVGKLTTDPPAAAGAAAEGRPEQAEAPYIPVVVAPAKALDNRWNGLDVRLTITAAQTDGKVLVVPLSAVSAAADGRTTVTVQEPGGERRVEVRAGVSGDGFVEVTPATGGLTAGDRVVVGR